MKKKKKKEKCGSNCCLIIINLFSFSTAFSALVCGVLHHLRKMRECPREALRIISELYLFWVVLDGNTLIICWKLLGDSLKLFFGQNLHISLEWL